MIEPMVSVYRGALKTDTLQNVLERIVDNLDFHLRELKAPESNNCISNPDVLKFEMFQDHLKKVYINTKNIEYEENVPYSDYLLTSKDGKDNLKMWGFDDIMLQLIVYRLGSYSYFTCDVHPVQTVPIHESHAA